MTTLVSLSPQFGGNRHVSSKRNMQPQLAISNLTDRRLFQNVSTFSRAVYCLPPIYLVCLSRWSRLAAAWFDLGLTSPAAYLVTFTSGDNLRERLEMEGNQVWNRINLLME